MKNINFNGFGEEAPCLNCEDRHPCCQDSCKELKKYKNKIKKRKKELKEIRDNYI